jgi:cytoskeletal protein CcmA (bactofilin family)
MTRGGELNGFLDAGSLVVGTIRFQDTLRIDGKVQGRIESRNDLVVGDKGEVEGEVVVGTLYVSGTVRGRVRTEKKIIVHRGGRLLSDIVTPSLVIEEGGIFEGSCDMVRGRGEGPKA